jgi:hypothetical protein
MMDTLQEEIKNMTLNKLASLYSKESDPHKKLKVQHALVHATKKKALEKGKSQ